MPVMDGIALALATARDHPHVTILLMTGYADQRERASNLSALIHDVITKPFTLATIRAAINAALLAGAQRRTSSALRDPGKSSEINNP
jgi:CheY-like chemotaxis protein